MATLQFGGGLAAVVIALVLFQFYSHRVREDQQAKDPDVQARAKRARFQGEQEEFVIMDDQITGTNCQAEQSS